jgi:hypothetical protein
LALSFLIISLIPITNKKTPNHFLNVGPDKLIASCDPIYAPNNQNIIIGTAI